MVLSRTMAFAQPIEEQFQAADAELNRVYKELRSKLNEEQKTQLKTLQQAWLKEIYEIADQPKALQNYNIQTRHWSVDDDEATLTDNAVFQNRRQAPFVGG